MDFIGTLRGAITWLGGAVAGLTVLCYGAGYFALHSYLAMLGLNGVVAISPDQMLTEGGEFWLALISELLRYMALAIVIAIVIVVPYLLLQHVNFLKRPARAVARKSQNFWAWLSDRYTGIGSIAVVLLFLSLLSWHYDSYFGALRSLSGSAVPQQQSSSERRLAPLLFQAPAVVVPGSSQPQECASTRAADPDQFGLTARALVARGDACRTELVKARSITWCRAFSCSSSSVSWPSAGSWRA